MNNNNNNNNNNILILRLPSSSTTVVASLTIPPHSPSEFPLPSVPSLSPGESYHTVPSTFLPLLLEQTKQLFMDYRLSLLSHNVPIDLFQGFADEIEALPFKYIHELKGTILLAVQRLTPEEVTVHEKKIATDPKNTVRESSSTMIINDDNLSTISPHSHSSSSSSSVSSAASSSISNHPIAITLDTNPQQSILVRTMGCIALKDIGDNTGEVKRLYVLPMYRRMGIAYTLSATLESIARCDYQCYYKKLVLDTLKRLDGALPLYERLGYKECAAYVYNPMPDVVFLEKIL